MEPKSCKCLCHAPKEVKQVCPPHTFGVGFTTIERGRTVMTSRVCKVCKYRQDDVS